MAREFEKKYYKNSNLVVKKWLCLKHISTIWPLPWIIRWYIQNSYKLHNHSHKKDSIYSPQKVEPNYVAPKTQVLLLILLIIKQKHFKNFSAPSNSLITENYLVFFKTYCM